MKRALLVGINYAHSPPNTLSGCINDAKNLERILKDKFDFTQTTLLLESAATRSAILAAISSEVAACLTQRVDELWLSFSGHGAGLRDTSGDEEDGQDETFIAYDLVPITDDVFQAILARVPSTTRVVVVFDSCHSGTMADLRYTYVAGDKVCVESLTAPKTAAHVVLISGCRDNELSSDAWLNRAFSGAMTSALLHTLESNNYDVTFFKLLSGMRKFLVEHGFTQVPQFTSSRPITNTSVFCAPKSEIPMLYAAPQ